MNYFHREVTTFLRDYGARDIDIIPGGKHPKLRFVFRDKQIERSIASSPSDPNATAVTTRDLRDLLGEPDVLAPPVKRTIDEISPLLEGQMPPSYQGKMACYLSGNKLMFRFITPPEIAAHFGSQNIDIGRLAHNIWRWRADPQAMAALRREGNKGPMVLQTARPDILAGNTAPWGRTPAEYRLMPDGTVQVRLLDAQHAMRKRPLAPSIPPATTTISALAALKVRSDDPAQSPPEASELRAVLAAISSIERRTPYRLVRIREGGGMAWQAPMIRLDNGDNEKG